jgi:hypothetical protein
MRMRRGQLTWWICAAAVVLGACGSGDPDDLARHSTTPGPPHASERSDRPERPGQQSVHTLRLASGLPAATQEAVAAFVAFAADPGAATAAEVPFASTLLVRVNDAGRTFPRHDAQEASAWFVADGEGTTSALFAISNSIVDSQGGRVRFVASTRWTPLCDLPEDDGVVREDVSVYVTLDTRAGCAPGFRIGLDLDRSATIRAVELAVRAP